MIIWAATWQNQQIEFVPSEDSDQPGHPPSEDSWSDWVNAQADLSRRWAHSHLVGFVMLWLISYLSGRHP